MSKCSFIIKSQILFTKCIAKIATYVILVKVSDTFTRTTNQHTFYAKNPKQIKTMFSEHKINFKHNNHHFSLNKNVGFRKLAESCFNANECGSFDT